MIDILFVSTAYDPDLLGGAEFSLRELARELLEKGFSVHVACLGIETTTERIEGVVIHRYKSRAFKSLVSRRNRSILSRAMWQLADLSRIGEARFLLSLKRELRPSIVHFNNISGFGWLAWWVFRKQPTVHTARDYSLLCTSATGVHGNEICLGSRWLCRALKSVYKIPRVQPSVVIGVSRFVGDTLADRSVTGRSLPNSFVYNRPSSLSPEMSDKATHASGAGVRFGFMGRVSRDKGVEVIVEAFAQLVRTGGLPETAQLIIAGSGEPDFIRSIEMRTTDLAARSQIQFTGQLNVADYLATIDVALVPTQWPEPFGRVVAEALQNSVPVIYSEVGGIPEVAERFGTRSRGIKEFNNPREWSLAMMDAQGWRARDMQGHACVKEPIANPTEEYLQIYKSLGFLDPSPRS
ncbi:Glycosyltransferase involved in cell wall bisynthesis [Propionibacterium cyclohexanicum]|uniref:Glycosyltransferase involved in cell wall bisynthesis n=1 Tax=Propionibacterium cyclohexanicum TaxID=64702 RepID=A0A1H9R3G1_9ACTN|nr:glycosyltransferase [Propionibacterium cyclohexanicum]SER67045.1 Glycosyltransferase involved in cell wall bisynthesis [Propionibacterium cyclohexanicum]